MASVEKALLMLRNLPRVALNNIKEYPEILRLRRKQVYKRDKIKYHSEKI